MVLNNDMASVAGAARSGSAALRVAQQLSASLAHPITAPRTASALASYPSHTPSSPSHPSLGTRAAPPQQKVVAKKYGSKLPKSWEKMLSLALKRGVAAKSLTKVKASYKLGEVRFFSFWGRGADERRRLAAAVVAVIATPAALSNLIADAN